MRSWKCKKFGPFDYFKVGQTKGITAWLRGYDNASWGFEWGYRDSMRGTDKPLVDFRVGKLTLLYFEKFKKGFEVWFLGFWWIA